MAHKLSDEERFILTLPWDYPYYYQLRKGMEESAPCAFCKLNPDINLVLFENEHWQLTENAFPNKRACEVMALIVSKEHWRKLGDIPPEAWASFSEMIQWAENHYQLPGGMLFLRFGDMSRNNGTIRHLHWNLWVPNKSAAVSVPIFKSDEERLSDWLRTANFASRYEAGETP